MSTYAELSEEEKARNTDDNTPTEVLAIDEEFLTRYAKELGYTTLERFLTLYIYDTLISIRNEAERAGALAFAFSHELGDRYYFPQRITEKMAKALMEFVNENN